MKQYSKTIAALVGLLAIISKEFYQIEIGSETVDQIVTGIMALGTVYAVYAVKNEEPKIAVK